MRARVVGHIEANREAFEPFVEVSRLSSLLAACWEKDVCRSRR